MNTATKGRHTFGLLAPRVEWSQWITPGHQLGHEVVHIGHVEAPKLTVLRRFVPDELGDVDDPTPVHDELLEEGGVEDAAEAIHICRRFRHPRVLSSRLYRGSSSRYCARSGCRWRCRCCRPLPTAAATPPTPMVVTVGRPPAAPPALQRLANPLRSLRTSPFRRTVIRPVHFEGSARGQIKK